MTKQARDDAAFPNGGFTVGLSKREYFAAMALQGLLANENYNVNDGKLFNFAQDAVDAADALTAELNKEVNQGEG